MIVENTENIIPATTRLMRNPLILNWYLTRAKDAIPASRITASATVPGF